LKNRLFVVVVGVNRYAEGGLTLKYARSDAQAMARLFRNRCQVLFSQVKVVPLLDEEATKERILKTLTDEIAKEAKPDDTLVVFLAGHGVVQGQRYYFIPPEFRRREDSLEKDVSSQGLPGDVLADAVSQIAARHRLLIFDTCASGGVLSITRKKEDPFAFRGAIEQLGRKEGTFVIAASGVREEAQESGSLGHGVLTYALLAGVKEVTTGPLKDLPMRATDPSGAIDVVSWQAYASGHVARLARQLLHLEQDVQISGQGMSYLLVPLSPQRFPGG
jgi:uncharacterized caspase-like protein